MNTISPAPPPSPAPSAPADTAPPVVGLVLGSGGARGIAHLGVLKALEEMRLAPQIAVGTSIGALVAAAYATGVTKDLREALCGMSLHEIARLFIEPNLPRSGLIEGKRVLEKISQVIPNVEIEYLRIAYAAVAFDIVSQVESVRNKGSLLQAIRASISIPGIFTPIACEGGWLVDGGLSNPLPVNVARAMGAKRILAVDINLLPGTPSDSSESNLLLRFIRAKTSGAPSIVEVLLQSIRVAENTIEREQLQKHVPDLLLSLPVGHIPTLDFRNPSDLIELGYQCTLQKAAEIQDLFASES